MEFIVHLFRNITLYKANYNTNTFDREALASASLNTRLYRRMQAVSYY